MGIIDSTQVFHWIGLDDTGREFLDSEQSRLKVIVWEYKLAMANA